MAKNKMKTKRSAAKRISVTASGKVKIKKANLRHILTKKTTASKRDKRKAGYLNAKDGRNTLKMTPYL
jgi:large subunit ribosomal protein L35